MKLIALFILCAILSSCHGSNQDGLTGNKVLSPNAYIANEHHCTCSEKHALDLLLQIPEVQKQKYYIDSLTNHKHGLSMIDFDQDSVSAKPYYEIHVGFSNDLRYETFFVFRVDKRNCSVKVDDPLLGVTSLKEWQEKNQKLVAKPQLTKVSLPISMSQIHPANYPTTAYFKNVKIEGETPTSAILLDSNVAIFFCEGDNERWYLATLDGRKLKDHLLIGKSETIEDGSNSYDNYIDFDVDIDFNVKLEYSNGPNFDARKVWKTEHYFINSEKKIVKGDN